MRSLCDALEGNKTANNLALQNKDNNFSSRQGSKNPESVLTFFPLSPSSQRNQNASPKNLSLVFKKKFERRLTEVIGCILIFQMGEF